MKNIFITMSFFVGFTVTTAKAQHTLEYSQALLIDNIQQTVPAGYVWKVTGVLGTRVAQSSKGSSTGTTGPTAPSINSSPDIIVNSNTIHVGHPNISVGGSISTTATNKTYSFVNLAHIDIPTTLPVWLPAGTTLEAGNNITYISVIEFKVN